MKKSVSGQVVKCHINQNDYEKFMEGYKKTLCRNKSDYMRRILLGKPVTVTYRNRSLDDFIEIAVQLRRDWRSLLAKSGFNQAEIEELKRRITLIEENLIQISEQCLQK
ncbi:MAG TPA: hypothetical protein VGN00_17290 [Puia sp.]|jgi:hypothetical protein